MNFKNIWQNPATFKKVNGWLTVTWFCLAFPICIFLSSSVPFLVFISVYAVVTGHLSTWQAARVEVEQAKQDKVDMERLQEMIRDLHEDLTARDTPSIPDYDDPDN